jgi:hypothetical protein
MTQDTGNPGLPNFLLAQELALQSLAVLGLYD